MKAFFLIVLGLIAIFFIMVISEMPSDSTSGSKKSNEIHYSAEQSRDIAAGIRAAGFNCPIVKMAYLRPDDAYGSVQKIWCGPVGKDGIYQHAVFRVTSRPNNTVTIKPWD